MEYKIGWDLNFDGDKKEYDKSHLKTFFEDEGCEVLIDEYFKTAIIKKNCKTSEVELLVDIFNKGHNFNRPQPRAVTLSFSLIRAKI